MAQPGVPKPHLALDASSWKVLSDLLDTALDLPEGERTAWLESLPPDLAPLRPRLLDLLARMDAGGTRAPLRTLPKFDAVTLGGEAPLRAEDRIGPYELMRPLGEGGMGTVWLARRSDGLIPRPVALKLPRGAWQRGVLAERMAREREILASLNHAHIAQLYDAGLTADGQPFLALEYVEGQPIDAYFAGRRLDTRERLRIFLQVVEAVAHAHDQMIVHRDLKPSNILVTGDGQGRLLDFGIAKLLDKGEAAAASALTETGGRALTPDYASPEQIAGKPVGAASDVYSLGVLLYELLTGKRPYQLQRGSRGALEEAILQTEPARPSTVAADPAVARTIQGELDWIILKAMAKERERRYPTAAALRDELQRYLRHEPVLAGPPSLRYRARKFVRRHRTAVIAASLALLSLAGGTVAATIGLVRARQAEAQARAEAQTAERTSRFLMDLFEGASPTEARGREVTAREMLDRGAARVKKDLAGEPLVQARMQRTFGSIYTHLGQYAQALEHSEDAVRLARSLGPRGETELAHALHRLGNLRRRTDDVKRAEAELRESLAIFERLGSPDAGLPLNSLALLLRGRDPGESLRLYSRALDLLRKNRGDDDGDTAAVLGNIGAIHVRQRRYQEAREPLERALAVATKAFGPVDVRVATTAGNLAIVHKELGDLDRALEYEKQNLAISEKVLGPDHPDLGIVWLNLARISERMGRDEQALAEVTQSLAILERKLPPSHHLRIGAANSQATYLMRLGRRREARALVQPLDSMPLEAADAHRARLASRRILAELERLDGRLPESLACAQRLLADRWIEKDPVMQADAQLAMAKVLAQQGQREAAEAGRKKAMAALDSARATADTRLLKEARYWAVAGEPEKAAELLRTGIGQGFRFHTVENDPAFASLRQHPAYASLSPALTAKR